jgi:Fe-S cluster biogenesis protein NfuA
MSEVLPVDPTVTIRAETSVADPDTCKFTLSRAVRSGGPFFFKNRERAAGSPLAEQLFALVGVAHVLVADNVVTVGKEASASWSELKSAIGAVIRAQLLTGTPGILDLSPAMAGPPVDLNGDVAQRVVQILEQQINPSIAAHGGHADLVAVEGDAVYLRLSGGCAGCGMAAVTLGQGIEVAIFGSVPEITRVIDVTDHAAGTNPYYEKAKK